MNNRGATYCYLLDSAGSRCLLGQGGLAKLVLQKAQIILFKKFTRNSRGKENVRNGRRSQFCDRAASLVMLRLIKIPFPVFYYYETLREQYIVKPGFSLNVHFSWAFTVREHWPPLHIGTG